MPSPQVIDKNTPAWTGVELKVVSIEKLEADKDQPRKNFKEDALKSLSETIIEAGVIDPLIVRPEHDGKFKIINGERRYRAAVKAGLKELPVLIRSYPEGVRIKEIQLIESLQNQALDPDERAAAIKELLGSTITPESQHAIAKKLGISQSSVAQSIALINLTPEIRNLREKNLIQDKHSLLTIGRIQKQSPAKAAELIERIEGKEEVKREEIQDVWKGVAPPRKKKAVESAEPTGDNNGGVDPAPSSPTISNESRSATLAKLGISEEQRVPSEEQKKVRIRKVREKLNLPDLPLDELFDRLAEQYLLLVSETA